MTLDGWTYWKKLSIANPSEDYQLKFEVRNSEGTSTATAIYVAGGCQEDYRDLRFTAADQSTALDYWIQTPTAASVATVWVKTNGEDTMYCYYSNSSATAVSNATNTFIQYHGAATADFFDSLVKSAPFVYEASVKITVAGGDSWFGVTNESNILIDAAHISIRDSTGKVYIATYSDYGGSAKPNTKSIDPDTLYLLKVINTGALVTGYFNGSKLTGDLGPYGVSDETMGLFLSQNTGGGQQDWSFLRKYAATEPTVTGYTSIYYGGHTKDVTYVVGYTYTYPSITKNVTYTVGMYKAFRIVGIEFDSAKGLYTLEFGAVDDYYMSQDVKNKNSLDIGHSLM